VKTVSLTPPTDLGKGVFGVSMLFIGIRRYNTL